MKLLILTQKVDKDDSVLGFFHRWIEEFAKHFELVTVICLSKGEYNLPANVKVLSLGKEDGESRTKYLWCFYQYIWRERKNYDRVFVHMNPEYVVLGGWLWKILGKKISLWYVHRQVNLKLRCAVLFCHNIFSVSPESFRFKSKKVKFVGHGIDTEYFSCLNKPDHTDKFMIISVGRITPIKNLEILIKAAKVLCDRGWNNFSVDFIGSPATKEDDDYLKFLKHTVSEGKLEGIINFTGAVPFTLLKERYCECDLSVNLAPTGGLDKAILESMSCGVPVLVTNRSLINLLGQWQDYLIFTYQDEVDLAQKIIKLKEIDRGDMDVYLKEQVREKYSLSKLIMNIAKLLN